MYISYAVVLFRLYICSFVVLFFFFGGGCQKLRLYMNFDDEVD